MAREITRVYPTLKVNHALFCYAYGIWHREKIEDLAKSMSQSEFGSRCTSQVVEQVFKAIERRAIDSGMTLRGEDPFTMQDQDMLCLDGSAINVFTKEVRAATPEDFFLSNLDIRYDRNAGEPKAVSFLRHVVGEEQLPMMQELFGYLLVRSRPAEKIFIFEGSGANGKGTTINLIEHFVGQRNCCHVSLQELTSDFGGEHAAAELLGKMVNLGSDISAKAIKDASMFKKLASNDTIRAVRKYEHAFTFLPYCKSVFTANQMPAFYEMGPAVARRIMVVEFRRTFKDDERDVNILAGMTTEGERSALLLWALEGLARLRANNWQFTGQRSMEDNEIYYLRKTDSIAAFARECVILDPEGEVEKGELFDRYMEYCRVGGLKGFVNVHFFRRLRAMYNYQEIQRRGVDGVRVRFIRGISVTGNTGKSQVNGLPVPAENDHPTPPTPIIDPLTQVTQVNSRYEVEKKNSTTYRETPFTCVTRATCATKTAEMESQYTNLQPPTEEELLTMLEEKGSADIMEWGTKYGLTREVWQRWVDQGIVFEARAGVLKWL